MEQTEIFQILGIEPTRDEKSIKNAYREKLSVTNPEDHPEAFKRLRTAFEEACRLAKRGEGEKADTEKEDMTPSGLWVAKAERLYGNIESRRDAKQWKKLFEEDIFFSLEEEENCRFKLVNFLKDHYKLPTEVWKLLDEKLKLVQDRTSLREYFPADFLSYIVNRCERGEDVDFTQFEGEPDAPYDLFLQYYEQCYRALDADDKKLAEELIQNADALSIYHPVMEICRAGLYEKQGRLQDAFACMESLRERYHEDSMICYNYAELLWRNGRREEAALLYEELKSENDSHYMANVRLTEWYFEKQDYKKAKKCAEKVLSSGGDDVFMELLYKVNVEIERELEECYRRERDWESALELCWCFLQDGKINAGIRLAEEIRGMLPADREAEYCGLLSKLLIEEAEYEKAISMTKSWETALKQKLAADEDEEERRKDQDRLHQAHMIRIQGFLNLGFADKNCFEKAISEIENLEADSEGMDSHRHIGLKLWKAQIYMEMEEYEKSLEVTGGLVEDYQIYAAYSTAMEVAVRQWDASGVIRNGRACLHAFPSFTKAYEKMAKVYLDLKYEKELKELLQEAEEHQVKSPILDAYRYQMTHAVPDVNVLNQKLQEFRHNFRVPVQNGELSFYEAGLPVLTEYLYAFPGSYMLVERAVFHREAHHLEEAVEDYEKALSENPTNPYALTGLSSVYRLKCQYEKALFYLNRAILYRDQEMEPYIFADRAGLYSLLGDYKRALSEYRVFAEKGGKQNRQEMKRMARCMALCKDVDGAAMELKEIYSDEIHNYYDAVMDLYLKAGESKKAKLILFQWEKLLKSERKQEKNLFKKYVFGKRKDKQKKTSDSGTMWMFYIRRAWTELLYGDSERSLLYFDQLIQYTENDEELCEIGLIDVLTDAVFASILLNTPRRRYAEQLQMQIQAGRADGRDIWHDMQKLALEREILSVWFEETEENIFSRLEREKECEHCHGCVYALCQELESLRILYLIRVGKRQEAAERLERDLRVQPMDEYLIAIRNRLQSL